MNENNCKITGIHEPLRIVGFFNIYFLCRWCHKRTNQNGFLIDPEKKPFNKDETYQKIVTYYIDKLHYDLEHANKIAEKIVTEQMEKQNI